MKYRLTKRFTFEASHQLLYHDGRCARLHGHSFVGQIAVEGDELHPDGPKEGMLVDYYDLGQVLKPLVDGFLDHHHLNQTLETDTPTSEFIARWVYEQLKPRLPMLAEVTIHETCTTSCAYRPE